MKDDWLVAGLSITKPATNKKGKTKQAINNPMPALTNPV